MSTRRFALLYVAPVALLLAWRIAPLAGGGETLFLRDVFNVHLPMKWAEAEALREGVLPLVDPYRAGGQPLAGNPNVVPFYPDNLLYLVAPLLWAFNAHFWLHLLAAPLAMYALGRALGLGRPAAWAAGVCYAFSGFFAAQLSFYNLVAGVALAPALAAAMVAAVQAPGGRRQVRCAAAAGLVWALLLTAGDPLTAVLALAVSASLAWVVRGRSQPGDEQGLPRRRTGWVGRLAAALAAGTLVALPQIVEFLRILPLSFRGYYGFSTEARTIASFDPRQALEWLVPFAFGRPDLLRAGSFWGERFYTGTPPYYFTLYPGLLALALVGAAGLPWRRLRGRGEGDAPANQAAERVAADRGARRLTRWAWLAAAAGLFVSLGRFNPLMAVLFTLAPAGAMRYPIKFWLPVAMAAAVLCGLGFERAFGSDAAGAQPRGGGRPARLLRPLAALVAFFAVAWLFLRATPAPAERLLRTLVPIAFPDAFVTNERLRWGGLCLVSLAAASLLLAAAALARRRPAAGGALLLAVHAAAQLFFLAPAMPTDAAAPYRQPPALLAEIPADSLVAHGAFERLFGPSTLFKGSYPEPRMRWLERRAFAELYPFAGPLWGRRYALNVSPERLDSFYTRLAAAAVEESRDRDRLRLLAAWGVDRLLLDRPLAAEAAPQTRLLAAHPSFGQTLYVYEIGGAAPEVTLATRILRAPHMNAAVADLVEDGFDPRTTVVVPGVLDFEREARQDASAPPPAESAAPAGNAEPSAADRPADPMAAETPQAVVPSTAPPATPPAPAVEARILRRDREHLVATTRSTLPGVLVWQRSYLPLYRAQVDGRDAETLVADLHRLGVEVPAGEHTVEIWVDRRPLTRSAMGSVAGLLLLALLALGFPRRRRAPDLG